MASKTTNSKVIWAEKAWSFRVDDVTLPTGITYQHSYIDHPGSVLIVPMLDEQTVVMIRQFRYGLNEVIWELPAGQKDSADEDWLLCAQRELREEVGYRADKFEMLGDIWLSPGMTNEMLRLYKATGLQADPLDGDIDEQIEVVTLSLNDALQLVANGDIKDAKTIVALQRIKS